MFFQRAESFHIWYQLEVIVIQNSQMEAEKESINFYLPLECCLCQVPGAGSPLGTYYGFLNVSSVFSFHPSQDIPCCTVSVCRDHDRQKSTVWRERQILDSDLIGRQEYRNDNIMICRHFSQIKLMTVPVIMVMTVSRSAMGGRYVRYDQMQHAATNPHS